MKLWQRVMLLNVLVVAYAAAPAAAEVPTDTLCGVEKYTDISVDGPSPVDYQPLDAVMNELRARGINPRVALVDNLTGIESSDPIEDEATNVALADFRRTFQADCVVQAPDAELYLIISDRDLALEVFWDNDLNSIYGTQSQPQIDWGVLTEAVDSAISDNGLLEDGAVAAFEQLASIASTTNVVVDEPIASQTSGSTGSSSAPPPPNVSGDSPESDFPWGWITYPILIALLAVLSFIGVKRYGAGIKRARRRDANKKLVGALRRQHSELRDTADDNLSVRLERAAERLKVMQGLYDAEPEATDSLEGLLSQAHSKYVASGDVYDGLGAMMEDHENDPDLSYAVKQAKDNIAAIETVHRTLDDFDEQADELTNQHDRVQDRIVDQNPKEAGMNIPGLLKIAVAHITTLKEQGFKATELDDDAAEIAVALKRLIALVEKGEISEAFELSEDILEDIGELNTAIGDHPKWLERLQTEIKDLEAKLVEVQGIIDDSAGTESELFEDFAGEDIKSVVDNNDEALKILIDVRKLLRKAQSGATMQSQQFAAAEDAIDKAEEILATAKKLAQSLEKHHVVLSKTREAVRTKLIGIGNELDRLEAYFATERDDVQAAAPDTGEQIAALKERLQAIRAVATLDKPSWIQLDADLVNLDADIDRLFAETRSANDKVDSLRRQIEDKNRQLEQTISESRIRAKSLGIDTDDLDLIDNSRHTVQRSSGGSVQDLEAVLNGLNRIEGRAQTAKSRVDSVYQERTRVTIPKRAASSTKPRSGNSRTRSSRSLSGMSFSSNTANRASSATKPRSSSSTSSNSFFSSSSSRSSSSRPSSRSLSRRSSSSSSSGSRSRSSSSSRSGRSRKR